MNELPFKLHKYHKSVTRSSWKKRGLNMDNFEEIYQEYIYATNCDLCSKEFPNTKDRHMEHDHDTHEFRNIVCNRCNVLKSDRNQKNNTSGYIGIYKQSNEKYKQGFNWEFRVNINGKRKFIKSSIDYDKLVIFANKWKIDNNYNT